MFFVFHKMKNVDNLWRIFAKIFFCGKDEKVSMEQESFNNKKVVMPSKFVVVFSQNPQPSTHSGVEKELFDIVFWHFCACRLRIRAFLLVLTTKHPYNCNRYKAARRKIVCQHTRLTNHLKNSTPASRDSVAEWPPAKVARSSPLAEPMAARSSAPNFLCP